MIGFTFRKPCLNFARMHLFWEVLENAAVPHVLNFVEWEIWKALTER